MTPHRLTITRVTADLLYLEVTRDDQLLVSWRFQLADDPKSDIPLAPGGTWEASVQDIETEDHRDVDP